MRILIQYGHARPDEAEIVPELRLFFRRVRALRREAGVTPYLNRLQRRRCRENLLLLEDLEREFHAVEHHEDFLELHRRVRRWLYLEQSDLARVLGAERVARTSLFLPRG